tara:strand:- start:2779 stop:8121 length:5343 start_codon:yes stop_codon:yes gene_type:complete
MDTIIRVFYEGSTYDLQLSEDIALRLDVSAVEAGELGSFFGVGSQEFFMPGTKDNNKFFAHAYKVGSDDIPGIYNTVQAYVIKKGETVLEGQLQLIEIITDDTSEYTSYKCSIVDSVVAFKDQLASKLLKDADWSPYSHSISSQSILDSWEGNLNGGSIFYPFAEYGYDDSNGSSNLPTKAFIPLGNPTIGQYLNQPATPLLPLQCIPSIRAKDVVDTIFDQVNYIPSGSWYEDQDTEKLFILPKGQEDGGVTVSEGLTPTFDAFAWSYPLQSITGVSGPTIGPIVGYNYVTTNNLNRYDNQCYSYETLGIGTHKFNASVVFFNPVWNTPGETVKIKININKGTRNCVSQTPQGAIAFSNEVELTSADGFNSFTLEVNGEEFVTIPGQDWWISVEYTYSTTGPVPNLTLYSGTYSCIKAPQVYDGVNVNMGEQFDARTKSIDLIKGLLEQFNLVMTPDPTNERVIRIDRFDEWVRDGRLVNWTERYDTAKREAINHTIDEVPRTLTFKQEKDEDRFSKLAIDNVPNLEYGSIETIADNNLSQGERSIGSYFGPLILQSPFEWNSLDENDQPTWNIDQSLNMVFPALYKLDNNKLKTFKFKPRIGYKNEIPITNDYRIYFGNPGAYETLSGSYYTLTNTSDYPVIPNSSNDTLFNNSFGSFVNNQAQLGLSNDSFNKNWKTYVDSLYWEGSKKLTLDIEFNANEYKDIRLNDKVYIRDQYYRINKISGFNVSHDDTAKVELIKLYPSYFQQDVVATPVPVVPVAPVAPSPPTPVPTISPAPTVVPVPVTPSPATAPSPAAPSPVSPVPIQPRPPVTIGTFYLTSASGTATTCALTATQTVYALTTNIDDIGDTINTLYADPSCTVPYFGNGYYYGISDTSGQLPKYELVVMGTGGVNGRTTCPTVTPVPVSPGEFYRGGPQGSSTNACTDAVDQGSLFVPYAPSVEYVQSGDTVYTDASFSLTFSGSNSWYALSNPLVASAQMAIQVNDFGRVVGRQDCVPLPPAPPPPSPSPAPIIVSTYYLSDAFGTNVGCSSTTDGYEVYANTLDINDILSGSVAQLFTDPTLTTPFFGNGFYYGVSDISSGSAKGELVILGTGFFSVNDVCQTVTPAPTSPGEFRRTSNFGSAGNTCGELTDDGTVFVKFAPSVGYINGGDQLYTDASFTSKFNQSNNSWYGLSDPNVAYSQRAVQVGTNGKVITFSDCVPIAPVAPIPTPAPVSAVESMFLSDTGYTTISGACAHAALDIEAFYDSNLVSASSGYPWTNGTKLYQDSGLTNVFTGSFLYWLSRPIINSYNKNNVSALYIQDDGQAFQAGGLCGTVPPVTSYKMGMTVPPQNNASLACSVTASVEVYSAETFNNITSGDYIYYDATLQTPVTGSNYVALAIITGSLPTKSAFVTNAGNLLSMVTCPPTPPPVTSYEYKATSGFLSATGPCTDFLDAYTFYSSRASHTSIQNGDTLYSDATLTTPTTLGGNGLAYGVGTSDMTYPSQSFYMVGGVLSGSTSCAGVPTPPPPVPVSQFYQYELFPCTGSGAIYRNSNVSASVGSSVTLSGSDAGTNCFEINSVIIYPGSTTETLENIVYASCASCQGAPTPPPPSPVPAFTIYNNAGYSSAVGCSASGSNTRFAATSSAHLQNGDVIYLSSALTTVFDGNNLNFGFSDTVGGSPLVQGFVAPNGILSSVTSCPPPPVPTSVYSHDIGDWNQSNIAVCSDSFTGTVYTAVPYADITLGTLVYTDSGLTTLFDGSSGIYSSGWFRFGSSGASIPILINSAGQMQNFGIVCS